jgi:transmembrane sensor
MGQPKRSEGNPTKRQRRDVGQPKRSEENPTKRQRRDVGQPKRSEGNPTKRQRRDVGLRDLGRPQYRNPTMESHEAIETMAAQWLARQDSGNWTAKDQAALDHWLEESTAHTVAYVRLEAAWARADRYRVLGAGVPAGQIPTPEEFELSSFFSGRRPPQVRHRVPRFRSLAASIVLVLGAAAAWYLWPFAGPDYKTPVGGTASVPVADGSQVILNTDSAIRVSLSDTERHVQLDQGEAYFEVAKDPARPFVVSAGNKRVVAVGTKFSVRRLGNDIRVSVTEGKVRIEEGPFLAGAPESMSLVAAGNVASTRGGAILVQHELLAEVEESLSWRNGYLTFHEVTLRDAVAEFNRYNSRKIMIEDPAVGVIRLSGKFRTTEYEAFVRLLEDGFPIQGRRLHDQIVLTSSKTM